MHFFYKFLWKVGTEISYGWCRNNVLTKEIWLEGDSMPQCLRQTRCKGIPQQNYVYLTGESHLSKIINDVQFLWQLK